MNDTLLTTNKVLWMNNIRSVNTFNHEQNQFSWNEIRHFAWNFPDNKYGLVQVMTRYMAAEKHYINEW